MKSTTISLYLDKRRPKENGRYPVKISIYYAKQQCKYSTGLSFTQEEWDVIQNGNITKSKLFNSSDKSNDSAVIISEIRAELDGHLKNAQNALRYLQSLETPFTADDVKKHALGGTQHGPTELQYIYNAYIENNRRLEKYQKSPSTVSGYKSCITVLKEYYEGLSKRNDITKLRFVEITKKFLREYRTYLEDDRHNTLATVMSHYRYIRALFNYAIRKGAISVSINPFTGDDNIIIQGTINDKRVITEDEITALIEYRKEIKLEKQLKNIDLALLSFMMFGANMNDIARLTYKDNYTKDYITFYRGKTSNSANQQRKIQVPISNIRYFIDRYGNKSQDKYIFDILRSADKTETEIRNRIKDVIRAVNRTLKRVAKKCGINEDISYQYFRHTYATLAIEHNATLADIMLTMGHTSPNTTNKYISTLPIRQDSPIIKYQNEILEKILDSNGENNK